MRGPLFLLVLVTVIKLCRSAWDLPTPELDLDDNNKVKVTLEGPRNLKRVKFFMSVNENFQKFREAEFSFKLQCQRVTDIKICSGSGGPVLSPGDMVYYGLSAKFKKVKKKNKLTGQIWTPAIKCGSFSDPVPEQCTETDFPDPTPDLPEGFRNPEKGWYKHTETKTSAWVSLDTAVLEGWAGEGFSLIYRNIVLDTFTASDISDDVLNKIQDDFDTMKENGMKVILRFCYSIDINNINDAPVNQLLKHIDQLAPVLQDNTALIAVMQAGFIGVWGEWFYTSNYGNLGQWTDEDLANRQQVVNRILQSLSSEREVQIRTPNYKRRMTEILEPLTEADAHQDTAIARIGHHNDCFLASATDYGTYINKTDEYSFLEEETRFVTMGGETCNLNAPRTDCETALKELKELHYTYLNSAYHPDVLSAWTEQGCLKQIESSLGYRLVGVKTRLPNVGNKGSPVGVSVMVRNIGWAAPINYRYAQVILRHSTSGETYRSDPSRDLRSLLPGDHELQLSVDLPISATTGEFQVLLSMPDAEALLHDLPDYNIVMENTQDADHLPDRLNLLGSINVA